jgi:hypothetical protein
MDAGSEVIFEIVRELFKLTPERLPGLLPIGSAAMKIPLSKRCRCDCMAACT